MVSVLGLSLFPYFKYNLITENFFILFCFIGMRNCPYMYLIYCLLDLVRNVIVNNVSAKYHLAIISFLLKKKKKNSNNQHMLTIQTTSNKRLRRKPPSILERAITAKRKIIINFNQQQYLLFG